MSQNPDNPLNTLVIEDRTTELRSDVINKAKAQFSDKREGCVLNNKGDLPRSANGKGCGSRSEMHNHNPSNDELLNAIGVIPSLSALSTDDHKRDLQAILGRSTDGEESSCQVALVTFDAGAEILTTALPTEDKFYFIISGKAVSQPRTEESSFTLNKELHKGEVFGLRHVLFGESLRQTVVASPDHPVQVLEVRRPALEILRQLPAFNELIIKEAIKVIPVLAPLLDNPSQFQPLVSGSNMGGKSIPSYVRLLSFEPGEVIIAEGESSCNSFYFVISGEVEAFDKEGDRIRTLKSQEIFGLKSFIFDTPRNATLKAAGEQTTFVLKFNRPALKILRNIPEFDELYDSEYRSHGKAITLDRFKQVGLDQDLIELLNGISAFKSISTKGHQLCSEESKIDYVYFISKGRVYRSKKSVEEAGREDYLSSGVWLGLDEAKENAEWPYSVTLMGFNEFLEIPIEDVHRHQAMIDRLVEFLNSHPADEFVLAPPVGRAVEDFIQSHNDQDKSEARKNILAAQDQIISKGVADANDLLVMDMSLCIHCGRCSLACHKIHGQSRLTRRGVQIVRPKYSDPTATQTLLVPETCIHCQDAKCLPACPSGAIGRLSDGIVDIDPSTCIGCGKCAKECPYNAVKMIERREESKGQTKAVEEGADARFDLKSLLTLGHDPLPATVEEAPPAELEAVKCNLCMDCPTLNPEGEPRKYGCEESCPTGALLRIKPQEYFNELPAGQHLQQIDEAHLVGRNIHKSDKTKKTLHAVGTSLSSLLVLLVVLGVTKYGLNERVANLTNLRWITGIIGLACLVIVMAYPIRRRIFKRRRMFKREIGALRYWLLAHYYAGITGAVVFYIHSGLDSGGVHTTLLTWLFDATIFSGLFAMLFYKTIPRLITRIEDSPVFLDDLKAKRDELKNKLALKLPTVSEEAAKAVKARLLSLGFLLRQFNDKENLSDLLRWARGAFSLDSQFELSEVVEAAVTLQRVRVLICLLYALKFWLPLHGAFTALMLAFMSYHIYQAFRFG